MVSTITICGIRINNKSMQEMIQTADEAIITKKQVYGTGINLNQLYLVKNNRSFAEALENATLLIADGTPIIWLSRLMGTPFKEKVCGSKYTLELFKLAYEKGYSVYILGGKPGSCELAIKNIKRKYNSIKIAGYYCPPIGFEYDNDEVKKIVNLLKNSSADILLMALSAPKQEIFVERYRDEFKIPVIFGAGIAIDYFANRIKQAPNWINNIGVEWLFRLFQEPTRLFQRYIINDLPLFFSLFVVTILYRLKNKLLEGRIKK